MTVAPDFALALTRHQAGELEEAERLYREILAGRPDLPSLHNLAIVMEATGRRDEARDLLAQAARIAPLHAPAQFALAWRLRAGREWEAAVRAYRRVLQIEPEHPMARSELGMTLLAAGRFEEGWFFYEQRQGRADMLAQRLSVPEWRGQSLAGKRLLVWREQGFGDQIMMARFLRELAADEIVYVGQPALQRLFSQLPVTYSPLAASDNLTVSGMNYWIMPSSLPAVLGARPDNLPPPPYLKGTPRPSGGRVGFVWRGEAQNPNNRFRAMPDEVARRILDLPGVISLAPEDTGAKDFQDTADIIAGLDLVISVDTSVAHLAGAMGHRLWVLVPAHGLDWQWMTERTDSPWYPSARLIRQRRPFDWTEIADNLIADLRREGLAG